MSQLKIVGPQGIFPEVSLTKPSTSKFIQIAAEIDARPAFLPDSREKRDLISRCRERCALLQTQVPIVDASLFSAILVPPGRGRFLKQRLGQTHVARFDFVILLECQDQAACDKIKATSAFQQMLVDIEKSSSFTHFMTATNVRRIAPVDHSRQGVFLFNYFFADDLQQNIDVWNYTAGWFERETGLTNSTVLLPDLPASTRYSIVNHCRWNHLHNILPSLLFKPSFLSYVLANFEANNVAAMPVLYRLV